ncbi:MAG: biopolymer transporter ExbD [Saprospiraceae bacterium]|nr:MAG: biopolymer transporter ExbD [Saprospiraceae bacterium]
MALKRRNRISAEFSMASLTDVIFLLLIFFVLTSKLVRITPFELPESDSKTLAPVTVVVEVGEDGMYKLGGQAMSIGKLEAALRQQVVGVKNPGEITLTIAAQKDQAFDRVVDVIEIAGKLKVKAILATQPKQS